MRSIIKTIILFFVFLIGTGDYSLSAQNPPPHAKAYGVKKKYRYYPQANVYFDPVVKRYTYLSAGRWTTVINLPTSIHLVGSYNDFDFEGDNPWKDNAKHKEKYKPAKPIKNNDVKKIETSHNSDNGNGGKKNKK